ncbi:hypothetical protein IFM89_033414 [Coptis chinensis]|uniref:Uncharacterized protein n=1 Tax=Coptis chinensis TaxID=261450 RepID=A0A835LW58_9MAGN|nr:hypothetical protein IFM89_033414 [Coptis chinensis]
MLQLELPHINVLSKIDLIENFGKLGDSLIRFHKWGLKKYKMKTCTRVGDSLVRAFGTGIRKEDVYVLWNLVNEIGENDVGVLSNESQNEVMSLFGSSVKGSDGGRISVLSYVGTSQH